MIVFHTVDFTAKHHDQFLGFVRDNSVVVVQDDLFDLPTPDSFLFQTASLQKTQQKLEGARKSAYLRQVK